MSFITEELKKLTDDILSDPLMEPWQGDQEVKDYVARAVYFTFVQLMIDNLKSNQEQ